MDHEAWSHGKYRQLWCCNYGAAIHHNVAADGTVTFGENICPANEAAAMVAEIYSAAAPKDVALKAWVDAWKCNCKAIAVLMIAFPKPLYRILISAQGMARHVMQSLYVEYMPQDHFSHVEVDQHYVSMYLDKKTHPHQLHSVFAQIAAEFPHAAADDAKKMPIIF
jgi:hypothetical protein